MELKYHSMTENAVDVVQEWRDQASHKAHPALHSELELPRTGYRNLNLKTQPIKKCRKEKSLVRKMGGMQTYRI